MLLYRWQKEYQQKGEAIFSGQVVQLLSDEIRRKKNLEKRLNDSEIEHNRLKEKIDDWGDV